MNNEVIEYIRLLSNLSFAIPVVFYLSRIRTLQLQHYVIGVLIILSAFADFVGYFKLFPPQILFNIYSVTSFAFVTLFYYILVYKKKGELVMLIVIGVYSSILLFSLFKYNIRENYTVLWSAGSLMIAVHAVVYIFNIPKMTIDRYFDRNLLSNMILNASLFCYSVTTFLIFLLANIIFSQPDAQAINAFWSLHNIFNILKNIGFALGFYYAGKREIYLTLDQLEKIARKLKENPEAE